MEPWLVSDTENVPWVWLVLMPGWIAPIVELPLVRILDPEDVGLPWRSSGSPAGSRRIEKPDRPIPTSRRVTPNAWSWYQNAADWLLFGWRVVVRHVFRTVDAAHREPGVGRAVELGSTSIPCVCVVCVIGDCACGYPGGNGANGGVGLGKLLGFAQSSVGSTGAGASPASSLR